LDRESVATVCRALGDIGSSEKLMFWLRDHGALAGKSVAATPDSTQFSTKPLRSMPIARQATPLSLGPS
jgi:hypothetical protein